MSNNVDAKDMKQSTKRELKPKLRFPEFRDAGEWADKTLDEIADLYKGKGISKADIDVQGKVPCIRYGELYTIYSEVIETVFSKTSNPPSDLFFSRKNDVIIPASGETKIDIAKASCVMHDNVALGGDLNVIRSSHNGVFLSYYLNGPKKVDIAKMAQGDTVVHLYPSQLQLLEIGLPIADEQQKIADCLSSIDELITAQTQKLVTLKTHKKGLMQQLFPAEGETLPKLRFPEFQDAGEWKGTRLGDLSDVRDGTHDSPQYYISGMPLLTSKNLLSSGSLDLKNVSYISKGDYEKINKRSKVDIGDILFGMIGTIGNPVMIQSEGFAIKNVALIKQKSDLLNRYLLHFLNSQYIATKFSVLNTGNSQKFIALGQIRSLIVLVPSILEQQKIANYLSSIDDLITVQTQKLNTLKTHKKALMQQLFPSLDEVYQ